MIRAIAATVVLGMSGGAFAQSGWADLGRAVAGDVRRSNAYEREYRRVVETDLAYWSAVRARQEAENTELQIKLIDYLARSWRDAGMPDAEARAVAGAFELAPEYGAILHRVRREGSRSGYAAAWDAYDRHQYLLANQLVLAASTVEREEATAADPASRQQAINKLFLLPDE